MQICARYTDKVLYVDLDGELDEHSAVEARRKADQFAEDYIQSEKAVFNLKNVTFMDSTGIGFLIGRYKKFRRFGIPMYITNPSLTTDKILSISGVYTLIPRI
ncbi:MAG: anti-sigma factor antagonist [Clostridia bacterium]|nr:anti-sigma factor antagonist [Clostridia bacterium]